MSKPFSLSKHERLKSKKQIDALFLRGEAFFIFPYKIKYCFQAAEQLPQMHFGISVPKRNFKRAVDRNKLKRLSREVYRIQKVKLKDDLVKHQLSIQVMFIYTHSSILTFAELESVMIKCLEKLRGLIPNTI